MNIFHGILSGRRDEDDEPVEVPSRPGHPSNSNRIHPQPTQPNKAWFSPEEHDDPEHNSAVAHPTPVSAASPSPISFEKVNYNVEEEGFCPPMRPGAPPPTPPARPAISPFRPPPYAAPTPPQSTPSPPHTLMHQSSMLGPERSMSFFRLADFVIVRPLGTGTFGRVYLARFATVAKYFALKKLRKVDVFRLKQVDHVQNERSLLSRLNHPFIIRLYSAMQDHRNLYMLLEYAPGGELFHYLRRAGRLAINAARFYVAELVLALEYLHANNITYRDLKPENLLLDNDGHLKLADFGFAKVVPNVTWTLCGTPEYLAPEIILGHGYGKGVDWWALGVLLFEMITGSPPFNGPTPTAVYEKTLRAQITYPAALGKATIDFLSGLLEPDVTKRLGCSERGAAEVKAMDFFVGVDWELVYRRAYIPPIIPPKANIEAAINFPVDDTKSSMDVFIENEDAILQSHGVHFPGFSPA